MRSWAFARPFRLALGRSQGTGHARQPFGGSDRPQAVGQDQVRGVRRHKMLDRLRGGANQDGQDRAVAGTEVTEGEYPLRYRHFIRPGDRPCGFAFARPGGGTQHLLILTDHRIPLAETMTAPGNSNGQSERRRQIEGSPSHRNDGCRLMRQGMAAEQTGLSPAPCTARPSNTSPPETRAHAVEGSGTTQSDGLWSVHWLSPPKYWLRVAWVSHTGAFRTLTPLTVTLVLFMPPI